MELQIDRKINDWFSKVSGTGLDSILLHLGPKGVKVYQSDGDVGIRFVDAILLFSPLTIQEKVPATSLF